MVMRINSIPVKTSTNQFSVRFLQGKAVAEGECAPGVWAHGSAVILLGEVMPEKFEVKGP